MIFQNRVSQERNKSVIKFKITNVTQSILEMYPLQYMLKRKFVKVNVKK